MTTMDQTEYNEPWWASDSHFLSELLAFDEHKTSINSELHLPSVSSPGHYSQPSHPEVDRATDQVAAEINRFGDTLGGLGIQIEELKIQMNAVQAAVDHTTNRIHALNNLLIEVIKRETTAMQKLGNVASQCIGHNSL
ncbi:uncharacterized protein N7484_007024 [Penicillium longicatenatum]|uniref:uncharacterized protein n=1 Tax=Penicillium longicatenatum TaxID=1561947 RepID=UPI002548B403|nr:uncharacterized protein N7484_007024 [Penicillium longicatenatum]KAJ5639162.1 hypothetical protein N7484_007024 [Penicillium longicatenatum]